MPSVPSRFYPTDTSISPALARFAALNSAAWKYSASCSMENCWRNERGAVGTRWRIAWIRFCLVIDSSALPARKTTFHLCGLSVPWIAPCHQTTPFQIRYPLAPLPIRSEPQPLGSIRPIMPQMLYLTPRKTAKAAPDESTRLSDLSSPAAPERMSHMQLQQPNSALAATRHPAVYYWSVGQVFLAGKGQADET